MQVFLSWSGDRSRTVAEMLHRWLSQVIQAVDPWLSSDIPRGARWLNELSDRLARSRVGVICLTPENLGSSWLLFEAGALSRTTDARVCTLLLDLQFSMVPEPLQQFQHTLCEKEDMRALVQSINERVRASNERALSDEQLRSQFEIMWPLAEQEIERLTTQRGPVNRTQKDQGREVSVYITGPREMPNFNVTRIRWDNTQCWLIGDNLRENIRLVPARIGQAFRIDRAGDLLARFGGVSGLELQLTDSKGNRWEVCPFDPLEIVFQLSVVEPVEKLARDYGGDGQ